MTRGMDRSPRTRPRTSPSARTAPAQRSTSAALESQEQGPGRLSAVRMRHLHDEIDAEGNVLLEGGPEGGDEPALARAAPGEEGCLETPQQHQPGPGAHASAGEVRPGRRLGSAARGGISAEPGAAEGLEPAEEQIAVDARAPSAGSRAGTAQRSAVREGADPQRAFIERRHCEGEAAGLTARVSRGRDTAELV